MSVVNFNPNERSPSDVSDPNALVINGNEMSLVPYTTPTCITPQGLGYQSGPDTNFYLGIDYGSNSIALDLPYTAHGENSIVGVTFPLQAPPGSYGWKSQNPELLLYVCADMKGEPNMSELLIPIQSASLSPLLIVSGSWVLGSGMTANIGFNFADTPIPVLEGEKVHFVLQAGQGWPSITASSEGYTLVWPQYDPSNVTTTFGHLAMMDPASKKWSSSNHVASFVVQNTLAELATTDPFLMYVVDAGSEVTWDFHTFQCIENPNGERGAVTYSIYITNSLEDYFNTSMVYSIMHVTQKEVQALSNIVVGRVLILQVLLNSPDGYIGASAGKASIAYSDA